MTAATGPLLWGRAAVLSGVALATGAFAHVQAGGLLPGSGVLVALVASGTLFGAPFLRRQGSTLRIVALLVAGQSVVHMALALTAGHRGDPTSGGVTRTVAPAVPTTVATQGRSSSSTTTRLIPYSGRNTPGRAGAPPGAGAGWLLRDELSREGGAGPGDNARVQHPLNSVLTRPASRQIVM